MTELEELKRQLAECQAREEKLRDFIEHRIPHSSNGAWCWVCDFLDDIPQDDTALREAIDDARKPFYRAMGRDFQHLEPEKAMSAWADALKAQAKREMLLEVQTEFALSDEWFDGDDVCERLRKRAEASK